MPMFAAQNPAAPASAIPPREGSRTKAIAVRVPLARVAGALASRCAHRLNRYPSEKPREAALEVLRDQGDQQEDDDHRAGDRGRHDRQADRAFAR